MIQVQGRTEYTCKISVITDMLTYNYSQQLIIPFSGPQHNHFNLCSIVIILH